jgi:hypothetical protein
MRRAHLGRIWILTATSLALIPGILPIAGRLAKAQAAPNVAEGKVAETTQKDQVDLAVTVYNSNIALVRDVRQLTLPSGLFPSVLRMSLLRLIPQPCTFAR